MLAPAAVHKVKHLIAVCNPVRGGVSSNALYDRLPACKDVRKGSHLMKHNERTRRGGDARVGAGLLAAGLLGVVSLTGIGAVRALMHAAAPLSASASDFLTEDTGDDDSSEVPPAQVDKYVAVYKAMQRDHSLTVEEAASKQGMTVAAFRSLEAKIERDDVLRERVRKALRPEPQKSASPSAGKKSK